MGLAPEGWTRDQLIKSAMSCSLEAVLVAWGGVTAPWGRAGSILPVPYQVTVGCRFPATEPSGRLLFSLLGASPPSLTHTQHLHHRWPFQAAACLSWGHPCLAERLGADLVSWPVWQAEGGVTCSLPSCCASGPGTAWRDQGHDWWSWVLYPCCFPDGDPVTQETSCFKPSTQYI